MRSFPKVISQGLAPVLPAPTRLPGLHPSVPISTEVPLVLEWAEPLPNGASLRLTVSLEDRDQKTFVVDFCDGEKATLEVICADPFQTLILPIPTGASRLSITQTAGSKELWVFGEGGGDQTPWFAPHAVLPGGDAVHEFWTRLNSLHSLASFGWKEGCVLEALWGRHNDRSALYAHLNVYGFDRNVLDYEDPRGKAVLGKYNTIEALLPAAVAARLEPDHSWVREAVAYWKDNPEEDLEAMLSTEGLLTVAYPLAVIGRAQDRQDITDGAIKELRKRCARLVHEGDIYLRCFSDDRRTHRNWSRGIGWYLLGLVKSLKEFGPEAAPDLLVEYVRAAKWVLSYQSKETGLWSCFLHEKDVLPDHAGCAGISAAILLGCNEGWLGEEERTAADIALDALCSLLTSDGLLPGCSQSNKGGEDLQRGTYRTASSYALGLLGAGLMASRKQRSFK